jgi:ACT domain
MRNYLIRVHLPDRPGALGAVASRVGSVGGDVVSFEILERGGGVVVDEFGVHLAGEGPIDLLRDEILEVDGVTVESLRPVEGELPDRNAELLDVTADLFRQHSPAVLLERLTGRVRASLAADFVAVVDARNFGVVAGGGGLPGGDRLEAMARLAEGTRAPVEVDPVATNARMLEAGLVLVVGRRHPVLRDRERQWVSVMADIADHGWRGLAGP